MQRSDIVAGWKLRGRSGRRIEMKRDAGSCSVDGMGAFVFAKKTSSVEMGNKHFVSVF